MKWFEGVAERAALQHGLCTRAQLLQVMTEDQLKRAVANGVLLRVQPRVYAVGGAPQSRQQALLAACLSAGGRASHRAAAELWAVPAPRSPQPEIIVVGTSHPRLDGVTVHRTDRLDRGDCTTIDGIPTTALARTVLDLGAVTRPWEVELAMEDAVLRLGTSIRAFRDCRGRMGAPGRNGAGVLRDILDWRDPAMAGSEGVLNLRLQRLFRRHRVAPWVAEHRLRGPNGERLRLDFAWPEVKLGVEADSARWHTGRLDVQRNARKANVLVDLGWSVYHYTFIDVRYRPVAIVEQIQRFLSREAA
jgi:hypothetical protein